MTSSDSAQRGFTLTWMLDASPAEVFQAWTDPDHLEWFYNDTMPIPDDPIELDLRVGGVWRQRMVIDATTDYVTGGVYLEIVPEQKLVYAWGAIGGWPELDPEKLDENPIVTVVLERLEGRTQMIVSFELPAHLSEDEVKHWFSLGVRDGMRQTVNRLATVFAGAPIPA
jgi:uncharacterized protein YndB with AHSA1/START domain